MWGLMLVITGSCSRWFQRQLSVGTFGTFGIRFGPSLVFWQQVLHSLTSLDIVLFDRRMGQGWVATSTFVSTVIKLKCNYCGKLFHSHELTHTCVIHIVHISGGGSQVGKNQPMAEIIWLGNSQALQWLRQSRRWLSMLSFKSKCEIQVQVQSWQELTCQHAKWDAGQRNKHIRQ